MANQKISNLNELASQDVAGNDLFIIQDTSNKETKKIQVDSISTYLAKSGSLTAVFSQTAATASYVLSTNIAGNVPTSSYSSLSNTSSYSSLSKTSQTSTSASYASTASVMVGVPNSSVSASYLIYGSNNGSASYANKSALSDNATNASYLVYTGTNNGTAYNSISASISNLSLLANTASIALNIAGANFSSNSLSSSFSQFAQTASFSQFAQTAIVGITTNLVTSASWATQSYLSQTASLSILSNNSFTSSYTLPTLDMKPYGMFLATTHSGLVSQIDSLDITPFYSYSTTSIEAIGSVTAVYTSSIILNESISLVVLDRSTGTTTILDSVPIYVNMQGQFNSVSASISSSINGSLIGTVKGPLSGSVTGSFSGSIGGTSSTGSISGSIYVNTTSSLSASYTGNISGSLSGSISATISGAIKFPYNAFGQLVLNSGSYEVYITSSSNKLTIEPTRTTRFNIDSQAGVLNAHSDIPLQLNTFVSTASLTFVSSDGGPFTDTAANIVNSGSSKMLKMDISNAKGGIRYIWTLPNLTYISSSGNTFVSDIGGMPGSIVTMSVISGALNKLYPLSSTSASILICNNNLITSLPSLPSTMSYINCSINPLLSLPTIPYGVKELYSDSTYITASPQFSNTILTMSFSNNIALNSWSTSMPTSLRKFTCSGSLSLTSLPNVIPTNLLYLNAANCSLTIANQEIICGGLVSNGQTSGTLNLVGNTRPLTTQTYTYISSLVSSFGWTVLT